MRGNCSVTVARLQWGLTCCDVQHKSQHVSSMGLIRYVVGSGLGVVYMIMVDDDGGVGCNGSGEGYGETRCRFT
jgi:hypothetical protein